MNKTTVTLLVTIALLITAEGALRVWAYFFRHSYQRYDRSTGMIRLVPNYSAVREDGLITVNSNGFRGREFSHNKPPGVYRIFALGDSATFGLAGEDCPYPAKLEMLLNSHSSGGHFEVINAGVEGYNSQDAIRLLEREVLQYEPDMITVYIGWNDLLKHDPALPESSMTATRIAYALYDVYLVKLWRKVIYAYLRPRLFRIQTDLSPDEEKLYAGFTPLVFRENIERMIQLSTRNGVRTVLFTLPSPLRPEVNARVKDMLYFPHFTYNLKKFFLVYSKYNETLRHIGRTSGVPVVDLQKLLDGREDTLFFDTAHMECSGHEVVANMIFRFLVKNGVAREPRRNAR